MMNTESVRQPVRIRLGKHNIHLVPTDLAVLSDTGESTCDVLAVGQAPHRGAAEGGGRKDAVNEWQHACLLPRPGCNVTHGPCRGLKACKDVEDEGTTFSYGGGESPSAHPRLTQSRVVQTLRYPSPWGHVPLLRMISPPGRHGPWLERHPSKCAR